MTLSARLKERIALKIITDFYRGYHQSAVSVLAGVEALEAEIEKLRAEIARRDAIAMRNDPVFKHY